MDSGADPKTAASLCYFRSYGLWQYQVSGADDVIIAGTRIGEGIERWTENSQIRTGKTDAGASRDACSTH
jgi:hypothetical protein